jgi:hypothetical protein
VAGAWRGPVQNNGATIATLSLTLNETSGSVRGNGALGNDLGSIVLNASGTYNSPNLSLTLSSVGFESVNLTATVGKADMQGTLNGSGFINDPITLTRQ